MELIKKQKILSEELAIIPDAYERLGYLVEYGKEKVLIVIIMSLCGRKLG